MRLSDQDLHKAASAWAEKKYGSRVVAVNWIGPQTYQVSFSKPIKASESKYIKKSTFGDFMEIERPKRGAIGARF